MGNVFQDALGCSWLMVDRLDVDQCFEWFVPTGAFVFEICLLLLLLMMMLPSTVSALSVSLRLCMIGMGSVEFLCS